MDKKELIKPELMAENVQLQEMDWQTVKTHAKEQIRQARVMLEINSHILAVAETELRCIWATMTAEERAKREADD